MANAAGRNPGWLLDEMSSIGRENLDATHVSRYDDKEDAEAEAEVRHLLSLGVRCRPDRAVVRHGVNVDGEWSRAELEEHVRDENATFTWLLEPMILDAGFEIRDVNYSDDGFFAKCLLAARQ